MIVVTADIHAHQYKDFSRLTERRENTRLLEIVRAVKWIADDGKRRGGRWFFVAGDLFHSRRAIEVPVLHAVAETLEYVASKYDQVFLIAGNHDQSLSGESFFSILPLQNERVTVILKPTVVECGKLKIGCLPWEITRQKVTKAVKKFKAEKCTGIIGHLGLDQAFAGPSDYEIPGIILAKDLDKPGLRWVVLGHYHKHQTWNRANFTITYVGSPLQHNWSERGETKGYLLIGRKPEFVENKAAPRFVLATTEGEIKKARKDDYVRIEGNAAKRVPKKLVGIFVHPPVVVRPSSKPSGAPRLPSVTQGDESILTAYLRQLPKVKLPPETDRDDLLAVGLEIIRSTSNGC